jgi:hypothetical protein
MTVRRALDSILLLLFLSHQKEERGKKKEIKNQKSKIKNQKSKIKNQRQKYKQTYTSSLESSQIA